MDSDLFTYSMQTLCRHKVCLMFEFYKHIAIMSNIRRVTFNIPEDSDDYSDEEAEDYTDEFEEETNEIIAERIEKRNQLLEQLKAHRVVFPEIINPDEYFLKHTYLTDKWFFIKNNLIKTIEGDIHPSDIDAHSKDLFIKFNKSSRETQRHVYKLYNLVGNSSYMRAQYSSDKEYNDAKMFHLRFIINGISKNEEYEIEYFEYVISVINAYDDLKLKTYRIMAD